MDAYIGFIEMQENLVKPMFKQVRWKAKMKNVNFL